MVSRSVQEALEPWACKERRSREHWGGGSSCLGDRSELQTRQYFETVEAPCSLRGDAEAVKLRSAGWVDPALRSLVAGRRALLECASVSFNVEPELFTRLQSKRHPPRLSRGRSSGPGLPSSPQLSVDSWASCSRGPRLRFMSVPTRWHSLSEPLASGVSQSEGSLGCRVGADSLDTRLPPETETVVRKSLDRARSPGELRRVTGELLRGPMAARC